MRLATLFSQTLLAHIFPPVPQGVILFPETGGGSAEQTDKKRTYIPLKVGKDYLVHRRLLQLPTEEFCTEDILSFSSYNVNIAFFVLLQATCLLSFHLFFFLISLIHWTVPFHPPFLTSSHNL